MRRLLRSAASVAGYSARSCASIDVRDALSAAASVCAWVWAGGACVWSPSSTSSEWIKVCVCVRSQRDGLAKLGSTQNFFCAAFFLQPWRGARIAQRDRRASSVLRAHCTRHVSHSMPSSVALAAIEHDDNSRDVVDGAALLLARPPPRRLFDQLARRRLGAAVTAAVAAAAASGDLDRLGAADKLPQSVARQQQQRVALAELHARGRARR